MSPAWVAGPPAAPGTIAEASASWGAAVWILLVAALVFAVADAFLSRRPTTWLRWMSKGLVPALLIVAVATASIMGDKPSWAAVFAAGALCLCLMGDLFLLEERRFVAGGVAFALAHVLFVVALLRDAWSEGWGSSAGVYVALGVVALAAVSWGWRVVVAAPGAAMRFLSGFYLLLVACTVVAAGINAASQGGWLALAGAALFLLSDLLLLRRRNTLRAGNDSPAVMGSYHLALFLLTGWALLA